MSIDDDFSKPAEPDEPVEPPSEAEPTATTDPPLTSATAEWALSNSIASLIQSEHYGNLIVGFPGPDTTVFVPDFDLTSAADYHEGKVHASQLADTDRGLITVDWATGGWGSVSRSHIFRTPEECRAAVLGAFEAKLARLRGERG